VPITIGRTSIPVSVSWVAGGAAIILAWLGYVRRMSVAVIQTMDTILERFGSVGITAMLPDQRTPEYLAKVLPDQIEAWAAPIRASGVSMK
jgi:hypothetical protein